MQKEKIKKWLNKLDRFFNIVFILNISVLLFGIISLVFYMNTLGKINPLDNPIDYGYYTDIIPLQLIRDYFFSSIFIFSGVGLLITKMLKYNYHYTSIKDDYDKKKLFQILGIILLYELIFFILFISTDTFLIGLVIVFIIVGVLYKKGHTELLLLLMLLLIISFIVITIFVKFPGIAYLDVKDASYPLFRIIGIN